MLRARPNAPDEHRQRKHGQNDLWIEVFGPDFAVVEAVADRMRTWLLENGLKYTGPASKRARRWFALRDYADRYNGAEERRVECLIQRFGVMSMNESLVDELQQFQSPVGARMMVRTRSPWRPPEPIVTAGHSNWRDD